MLHDKLLFRAAGMTKKEQLELTALKDPRRKAPMLKPEIIRFF
jgi:hypothetical protein